MTISWQLRGLHGNYGSTWPLQGAKWQPSRMHHVWPLCKSHTMTLSLPSRPRNSPVTQPQSYGFMWRCDRQLKLSLDLQGLGNEDKVPWQRHIPAARSPRHSASIGGSDFNTLQAWRTSWQQTPPTQLSVTPKHKLTTGRWPSSQGLGNIESATDWSWPIQRQYAPLGSAPISSLPMRSRGTDRPSHHPRVPPSFPHPTIWTSKT